MGRVNGKIRNIGKEEYKGEEICFLGDLIIFM